MAPTRAKSCGSAIQRAALASFLLFGAACSGGGGTSPTEPPAPAPALNVLQISWEFNVGEGPVTGTTFPIAGNTVELWSREKYHTSCWSPQGECNVRCQSHEPGEYCIAIVENGEVVDLVFYPDDSWDIAECRTTAEGETQAFYHDAFSGDDPGSLGPLVASGCSKAEQWGYYAECCLVDS